MIPLVSRKEVFQSAIREHLEIAGALELQQDALEAIAIAISDALREGRKILWCGNGGSAADSQHLAAELVGRFRRERYALASLALTTDSSILTAVANDYGYNYVFARQVEAIGQSGDVLVGISTSGNSANVVAALEVAKKQGLITVAFTGSSGGKMREIAQYLLTVPSSDTARIQEAHILAGHMICDWVELSSGRSIKGPQQVER